MKKRYECEACGGLKKTLCEACATSKVIGKIPDPNKPGKFIKCPNCNRKGLVKCESCRGRGFVWE